MGERNEKGERHGQGIAVLPNRDQYEGDYKLGLREGNGCYYFVNGARYEGEWKKGLKHGKGKFNYPDGSRYCGEWKNGFKHGFGMYCYRNEDVYEGNWFKGKKHGVGCYTFKETNVFFKATWQEGIRKGPIEVIYPNYRYHGCYEEQHPVGPGVFSFGMKYIVTGHCELISDPEIINTPLIGALEYVKNDTRKSLMSNTAEEDLSKSPTTPNTNCCITQFVAKSIMPYNYSTLPQEPIPLPQTESESSFCSKSSVSDDEVNLFQVQSPILIEGIECGEDEHFECDIEE